MNLTDSDAQLTKGRHDIKAGYNAQAMVSPLDPAKAQGDGLFITAADASNAADDYGKLVPMMGQAEEMTGQRVKVTLADGGYHTGTNLEACEQRGQRVAMPDGQREAMKRPYFKDRFEYQLATDSYICPHSHRPIFQGLRRYKGRKDMRVYRATEAICLACPAFGICTKDRRWGRTLWIGPHDALLRRHRQWMDKTRPVPRTPGARNWTNRPLESSKSRWERAGSSCAAWPSSGPSS